MQNASLCDVDRRPNNCNMKIVRIWSWGRGYHANVDVFIFSWRRLDLCMWRRRPLAAGEGILDFACESFSLIAEPSYQNGKLTILSQFAMAYRTRTICATTNRIEEGAVVGSAPLL